MASRSVSIIAILLSLNLVFFTTVSSTHHVLHHHHHQKHQNALLPSSSPPAMASCPKDTLKLGVCADLLIWCTLLWGPQQRPLAAASLGLADPNAAVCLCTAIKANILGINLNVPVSLSLLLNYCGKSAPKGNKCI